jgi:hypothetical protein
LLEKANVPKRKRLWWFSGEWAMVKMYKSDVIAKHKVKVRKVLVLRQCQFHIDSRMINGAVIWTFCWFSTRFLKMVPILICLYLKPDNIIPMIAAGIKKICY